jgi:uncharacterized protein (DUF1800 family)
MRLQPPSNSKATEPAEAPGPKPRPSAIADDAVARSLRQLDPKLFGYDQARHLLWRAGLGGTDAQISLLVDWGLKKSVDYIVDFEKVPFEEPTPDQFDKDIMRPPDAEERAMVAQARRSRDEDALARLQQERQRRERLDRSQMGEVQKWWLRRMIETPRPLEEKLTLLWHGHFATNYRAIENSWHMFQQNQLFRQHAAGNFGELLGAIIRDPAMIAYLNNNQSRKGRPNENLARELMELFSLGVGNYTEKDIKEGARALTGYTFEDDQFVFQRQNHDNGTKTILGRTGTIDGDGFVAAILAQRACASFIARKLYHHFVADVPPDERGGEKLLGAPQRAVLMEMASTLLEGRYEVKPLLRKLFLSQHFYEKQFVGQQIKSPVQLVVGAIRSLNTPPRDLSILNDALRLMGQDLYLPPSVKGWDGGRSWINTSTLFVRQNVLAFLLTGRRGSGGQAVGDRFDAVSLLPEGVRGPAEVIDAVLKLTLGQAPAHGRETLASFLGSKENAVNNQTVTGMLLLATAMPEYQLT